MYELIVKKRHLRDSKFPHDLPITGADIASAAAVRMIADRDQEVFLAFYLDAKNIISSYQEVSIGSISVCPVDPRVFFRGALLTPGIVGAIAVHNHPSGEVEPSREDDATTRRLYCIGQIVGIELLDHIIVSPKGYTYSYVASGKMESIRLSSLGVLSDIFPAPPQ